jgi:hypothetical protein
VEVKKLGDKNVGTTLPENPALQAQPEKTFCPVLLGGHMLWEQLDS